MKILIFGWKGWLGQKFIRLLKDKNITFEESKIRVEYSNKEALIDEIKSYNPTHIISFIGRIRGFIGDKEYKTIDYLEQEDKLFENMRDNFLAPLLLHQIIKEGEYNIHFTYIGTGCIFEYKEDITHVQKNPDDCYKFTESDKPNFFGSSYSIVKGYTDTYLSNLPNVLNIRIRMPISELNEPQNFITKISKYEKICSIPNSMTVLPTLLPYMVKLMERNYSGTVNMVNPGVISHNEVLEMYKEYVDPSFKWKNFTIEEQAEILSSKRSNNYLDTTLLESLFPEIKNIKDAVRETIQKYNFK
jgi:dTDP-4-dehydrorhamnose reductase